MYSIFLSFSLICQLILLLLFFFLYCIEVYIIIIQISYDHRCFFVKISFFISIKYRLIDVFVCVYVFVYE